jgi:hypothetical protein
MAAASKMIVHETKWAKKTVHGSGGKKFVFKREAYMLSVTRSYAHWCGDLYANLKLEHAVWSKPHEKGKVSKRMSRLCGTANKSKDGRPDIRVTLPAPFGQVYLHILAWFFLHNDGQFKSWSAFRRKCLTQSWDIDHGERGTLRRVDGKLRRVLDVHSLVLTDSSPNRGQGESIRQLYSKIRSKA